MEKESLNDLTYQKIKEDILSMRLEPGSVVSAQKLSERYGVSRTPVREAIVQLQKEGLINIVPQSGSRIACIDLTRVRQEWFIRRTLEIAIAKPFLSACTDETVSKLQELLWLQQGAVTNRLSEKFFLYDNEFHQILFFTAGEELAWNTIENTSSHYNRIRRLSGSLQGIDDQLLKEHECIWKAAKERNIEMLERALGMHLEKLAEDMIQIKEKYPCYFAG